MQVWINGKPGELADGAVCRTRDAARGAARPGWRSRSTASVVPRAAWPATVLAEGARVEVLTAVQGG